MNTCPNCGPTPTGVTVTLDVPLCPSLVAEMVAEPAATPVTSPLPFTVATAVLLLDQTTTRPVSGVPFASLGVAVSCTVCPACTLAGDGLTVTEATGTGGALGVMVRLQTVCVPGLAAKPKFASDVTALCSVRKARPVPMVASAAPAGAT